MITAPEDGIVSSIVSALGHRSGGRTARCWLSLYVGDQKEMVVSVDELDIINVAGGAERRALPWTPLTDQDLLPPWSARSARSAPPNGGVTVYNVTLTIDGDENLKFGMNGTATILHRRA